MITRRTLLSAPAAFQAVRAADVRRFHAGAATANISPHLGCSLAGNMTDHLARDLHDELHVRALVLDNGQARLALATVDSCAVPRSIFDAAKQLIQQHTGIPASHVLLSATHSHSCPAATHLFQSLPDPQYTAFLTARIADAVRLAVQRLEPAQIGWGIGREPSQLFNRRYHMKPGTELKTPLGGVDKVRTNPGYANPNIVKPAGPIDPDLGILAVHAANGRPVAVLGSYALHYVGGTGADTISADYFPVWGDTLLREAGLPLHATVTMMTNACSGNINNVDVTAKPQSYPPFGKIQQVSAILAAESLRVWKNVKFESWVDLKAAIREIELGVRLPSTAEAAAARKIVGDNPPNSFRKAEDIYARETVFLARDYQPSTKVIVQALRLGGLGIGTFPGEAFCELGLEVKKKSPTSATMIIELANGYHGYIPTEEAHAEGGYETWRAKSSFLAADAAPKMVAGVVANLQSIGS